MTPQEFARECDRAAQAVRSLPRALQQAYTARTRHEVADPLAARIRSAGRGVYGTRIAPTATVRTGTVPLVVVGGTARVVSGGATARDLLWGNELAQPARVAAVPARSRQAAHRRRSNVQTRTHRAPFILRTVNASIEWAFERWAKIADDALDQVTRG